MIRKFHDAQATESGASYRNEDGTISDLSGITELEKEKLINDFVASTARNTLAFFASLGLNPYFEGVVVNHGTGERFILSFKEKIKDVPEDSNK